MKVKEEWETHFHFLLNDSWSGREERITIIPAQQQEWWMIFLKQFKTNKWFGDDEETLH